MADTHGFELIIQASQSVVVKALKGAWKSAECPDQPDDAGRIPEFMDIPAVGTIGGFPVVDGQVQIPQDELDAAFATDVGGVELILGINVQIEIGDPPVPSARLLDFHTILHAKAPVNTMPGSQNVGILLGDMVRANVWAVLDAGHPLDASIPELLQDYVHKAYEDEQIPHLIVQNNVAFGVGTCSTTTQIYDDEANPARQILNSFPDPATLRISIPVYLRMYAFIPDSIGPLHIEAPMGIETRLIIDAPFEKHPEKYVARFGDVVLANVSVGPIAGAGSDIAGNPNEANNYNTNKARFSALDLEAVLSAQLRSKGVTFANDLGNREVAIPSSAEIEATIADLFFTELSSRSHISIWTPTASDDEFEVNSVDVKVFSDSLNIALNSGEGADIDAITFFIPAPMEFSIAMSKASLEEKISQAIAENGFDSFPKRFHEDGKDVDLNSLNISVVNHAIRLTGSVTVIDAVLGSIDVDADFTTNVGLHWEPSGVQSAEGFQELKHHIIGDPDVDVDEGIAFWIVAIILAVISFGVGGVLIGIISIVIILVVEAIVENIGSDSLVNGVSGAVEGITAWPPELSNIGRVKAVFFDPVDISDTGLVLSGQMEVISSCETTEVVPATTAKKYTVNAVQAAELKALRIYPQADYFWNPGDGSATQPVKTIFHAYDNSGIYLAKHGLKVNEFGGAQSRHFGLVRVKNVGPTVDAGPDITVNEGEIVTLEAYFEDVEYLDTHWSVWNFGDDQPTKKGFVEETNIKPKSKGVTKIHHAWCDNGVYAVSVQVIDNNGGVGTATKMVTVLNVPPTVVTPERIYAYTCSPITLTGDFTDPGWCDTHVATWHFGDCSGLKMAKVEGTNKPPAAKGTAVASHIYKQCGSFYAECVVTDDDGGVGKSQTIVEVTGIQNGHFNEGFSYHPAGKVANCWHPFALAGNPARSAAGQTGEAVFYCEKCLVLDGLSSQRIVLSGGSAGIYQQIKANPGWVYQVEARYMLQSGSGFARLGIDPFGQTDPASPRVIWSKGNTERAWSHLMQRTCAKENLITVFLGLESQADRQANECCFDVADLIAMQNISCETVDKPVPEKSTCVDFSDVKEKQELPAEWTYKRVTFISSTGMANFITSSFPPDHIPCLAIRRGLLLRFGQPVEDLTLEFRYHRSIGVGIVASDSEGVHISKKNEELNNPAFVVTVEGSRISQVQIVLKGEAGLAKVCFRKTSYKQEEHPFYIKTLKQ
ncbi:PKD domain-containing protein [Dyadobacter sp. Leaf189]|uniref:PKD domain-containing protein n=1 Tax=Dyadobacter sp. Leaf189 TaxID=1736295 RepID=UPI0006FA0B94|nr:PKD domain-containing protein [Dyadobacter sp. Leaf189]KQS27064.1 hypothetical protein ASG33_21260 [Dyadobacter sp. Leaf189]